MAQRRKTAAFARPSSAVVQLRDVAAAVQRGATVTSVAKDLGVSRAALYRTVLARGECIAAIAGRGEQLEACPR